VDGEGSSAHAGTLTRQPNGTVGLDAVGSPLAE